MALKNVSTLILALGFLLFLGLFLFKVKGEMVDFEVNYQAGKRIQMGETLYRLEDGHYQFKYPPFSAFLDVPLSRLSLSAAKAVWFFVSLLFIFLIFWLSTKLVSPPAEKMAAPIVLSVLILARYFLRELQLGQINALMTFLLLVMIWMLAAAEKSSSPGWEKRAGFLWGLASSLKPYGLIFLPYFFIKKKGRALLSGGLFLGFAFLAPSLFYGVSGNFRVFKEWISTLSQSTPALLSSQDNISVLAFFIKWTGNQSLSLVLSSFALLLLAFFFLFLVSKGKMLSRSLVLETAALLILIPLLSPLGWDYTLLSSVLGIMMILKHFAFYPKFFRIIIGLNFLVIAFSLYDILSRSIYTKFMSWSVITINFLILLCVLSYLRLKKVC